MPFFATGYRAKIDTVLSVSFRSVMQPTLVVKPLTELQNSHQELHAAAEEAQQHAPIDAEAVVVLPRQEARDGRWSDGRIFAATEDGVDEAGHERGIQTDLWGKSGHTRVGYGLKIHSICH